MDANELATIAIGAMELSVLTPFDQGHIEGVLTMALLTMETQHESLLAEADEEAAATMRTLVETQQELIAAKAERDGWRSEARELQRRIDDLNAVTKERDDLRKQVSDLNFENSVHGKPVMLRQEVEPLRSQLAAMTQERNNLQIAYNSAMIDRENFRKERDELRSRQHATQDASLGRIHYAATQPGHLEP